MRALPPRPYRGSVRPKHTKNKHVQNGNKGEDRFNWRLKGRRNFGKRELTNHVKVMPYEMASTAASSGHMEAP
jgi:hypothetical protein